jgi:Ca-activated chloride channel family protein
MDFVWPWTLLLLLFIPLAVAVYIWILRRKRRYAVRYSSLSLIREALPKHSRWRRHLPFALFLGAVASLMLALARPEAEVVVPLNRTTIMLALDVSRSMCATDVSPNRLAVAQEAALAFVDDQVEGTQIGLVAFATLAEVVVPPTRDKNALKHGLTTLSTALGTAIGSATLKSIDAIAEINPEVELSGIDLSSERANAEAGDEESYQPDIIVLLTDGANTRGADPLDAAHQATERGIRVYTIGFGTQEPGRTVCSREQLGGDAFSRGMGRGGGFGGGFGGGSRFGGGGGYPSYLLLDEPTLQAVAETTGGEYFRAESADQLLEVFLNLPAQIVLQKETTEVSVLFSALGAILAAVAVGLSLWWHRFS